jgi:hypothetical protein
MRLFVVGLAVVAIAGCILEEALPPRSGPAIVRAYAAHGPNCPAIEEEGVDRLVEIAAIPGLTTHEQVHLIDVVVDDLAPGFRQGEVLAALAANPALTEDARTHLSRRMRELVSDEDRAQVGEALSARN